MSPRTWTIVWSLLGGWGMVKVEEGIEGKNGDEKH